MKEKENTARGQEIEKIMIEGRIVPAEITVALLLDAIRENMAKGNTQFLVDGSVRGRWALQLQLRRRRWRRWLTAQGVSASEVQPTDTPPVCPS